MVRYSLRRIAEFVALLAIASVLVWLMIYLVPGDPALLRLGPNATAEQLAAERSRMGLDDPVLVQYVNWLGDTLTGDLGESATNGESVVEMIKRAFPVTLSLTIGGMLIAVLVGVPLGVGAALRPTSRRAKLVSGYTSLGLAIPTFWTGMLLVWLVALTWQLLPSSGYVPPGESLVDYLRHLALPALTLGIYGSALVARFVASSMADTLNQDYLWTARAKGVSERTVVRRHALRNALIPVVTVLGLQFGLLLGGAVIIEAVFNLPGMGRILLDAVGRRDYVVVQGFVLFIVVTVALMNVLVDLMYTVLDPRIRTG